MKVTEEGTDRSAEMHFYVEGSVDPLREYGEYVAADYAVCCYVPVEEGNKPKIIGKFTGTTKEIACDALVDGIHRRSIAYQTKDVQHIKKKIDFDTFLFMTDDGAINSQMLVAPLSRVATTKKSELDSQETVGTVELRLYVTRELGVFHKVENTMYDSTYTDQVAHFNQIPPTFQLDIDRNSTPMSKRAEGAFRKRMISPRPGREPWAVFRFHYRSEEGLEESGLPVVFDVRNKKLTQPRILPLEPLPPLIAEAETKRSENGGSHTPTPFVAEIRAREESLSSKSSTPNHDMPTIKPKLGIKTMASAMRGIESLRNRAFKKPSEMVMESPYIASTEGVDNPTSIPTTREQSATAEVPDNETNSQDKTGPSIAASTKRSLPTTDEAPPGPKRSKPLNDPLTPQNVSVSNVLETILPENRLFHYRKKLADLRKTWLEKDKELATIKNEMDNYKRCMNEELDRINREVLEEENAFTEEVKHCSSNNIRSDSDSSP